MIVTLAALPAEEIEAYLAKRRPDWNAKQQRAGGAAVGRRRGPRTAFDLAAYTAARSHALAILHSGLARRGPHRACSRSPRPTVPAPKDATKLSVCCGPSTPCSRI